MVSILEPIRGNSHFPPGLWGRTAIRICSMEQFEWIMFCSSGNSCAQWDSRTNSERLVRPVRWRTTLAGISNSCLSSFFSRSFFWNRLLFAIQILFSALIHHVKSYRNPRGPGLSTSQCENPRLCRWFLRYMVFLASHWVLSWVLSGADFSMTDWTWTIGVDLAKCFIHALMKCRWPIPMWLSSEWTPTRTERSRPVTVWKASSWVYDTSAYRNSSSSNHLLLFGRRACGYHPGLQPRGHRGQDQRVESSCSLQFLRIRIQDEFGLFECLYAGRRPPGSSQEVQWAQKHHDEGQLWGIQGFCCECWILECLQSIARNGIWREIH